MPSQSYMVVSVNSMVSIDPKYCKPYDGEPIKNEPPLLETPTSTPHGHLTVDIRVCRLI